MGAKATSLSSSFLLRKAMGVLLPLLVYLAEDGPQSLCRGVRLHKKPSLGATKMGSQVRVFLSCIKAVWEAGVQVIILGMASLVRSVSGLANRLKWGINLR